MGHYKSNVRDIEFNLFEVLNRQDLLGSESFPEIDDQTDIVERPVERVERQVKSAN